MIKLYIIEVNGKEIGGQDVVVFNTNSMNHLTKK
jgi:hypothetical protein